MHVVQVHLLVGIIVAIALQCSGMPGIIEIERQIEKD
jgi:hypothetical protein